MTIFQLAIFSCVILTSPLNSDYTKTCHWLPTGMFVSEESCIADGKKLLGKPLFSDVVEDRKVNDYRCTPLMVQQ